MNRSLKDFMLFRKLNFHICELDFSFTLLKSKKKIMSSIFNSDFSLCTSLAKISASEISLNNENNQNFFSLIAINLLRIHTVLDNIQICKYSVQWIPFWFTTQNGMHIVYWQGYIIQKKLPFSTSEKSLLHSKH